MKSPTKPWAPYKPTPPQKKIEERKQLAVLTSQEDIVYNLQSFQELIQTHSKDLDLNFVKFEWEIDKNYGYYNDVTTDLKLKIYTISMIDDPNYDKLLKQYDKKLLEYKEENKKYKAALKQYEIDEEKYCEYCEEQTLKHARATVKRLESKIK